MCVGVAVGVGAGAGAGVAVSACLSLCTYTSISKKKTALSIKMIIAEITYQNECKIYSLLQHCCERGESGGLQRRCQSCNGKGYEDIMIDMATSMC